MMVVVRKICAAGLYQSQLQKSYIAIFWLVGGVREMFQKGIKIRYVILSHREAFLKTGSEIPAFK